jgi:hypothetical protein
MHVTLAVQKAHSKHKRPKGHALFVFDSNKRNELRFTDLVMSPPEWTDTYYGRKGKESRLGLVVDVPFFGDSKEVSLIQVADFLAFFLRHYIELKDGLDTARYAGEDARVEKWAASVSRLSVGSSFLYPKKGRCPCAEVYYAVAPEAAKSL